MLKPDELHRYSRQILIPGFGEEAQLKLKKSKVLVIGAGGLGSPILLYLAAAGCGTIGIVDFDVVDISNLQRQVLFSTAQVGQPKSERATERIKSLNPGVDVRTVNEYLSSENAIDIIKEYDLVIDGSDNLPTRYLVNDACVMLNKTLIYGAIFQFEGQVSVFNSLRNDSSRGPNYRDLFPTPPPPEMVPSCSEGGVLGVLPGIIGSMMASEGIKVITGLGATLDGRLLLFDAFDFTARFLKINKNPNAQPITKLIDYAAFCNPLRNSIKEIEPREAKALIDQNSAQIIDVREPSEFAHSNIGGINIPLSRLEERIAEVSRDQNVILVCRSGTRSEKAVLKLRTQGFQNILNLKGGLLNWKDQMDNKLSVT